MYLFSGHLYTLLSRIKLFGLRKYIGSALLDTQELAKVVVNHFIFKNHQRLVWGDGSAIKGSGGFSYASGLSTVVQGL